LQRRSTADDCGNRVGSHSLEPCLIAVVADDELVLIRPGWKAARATAIINNHLRIGITDICEGMIEKLASGCLADDFDIKRVRIVVGKRDCHARRCSHRAGDHWL